MNALYFIGKLKDSPLFSEIARPSPWWGSLDGQHASSRGGARSTGERNPSRGWEEDLVGGLQIATVAGCGGDRRGGPIGSGLGDNREGVVVTG